MENQVQNQAQKPTLKQRLDRATTVASVAVLSLGASSLALADDVTLPADLVVGGLGVAAAGVFAIKASPSLMMWGYRKLLGFIGR
ncbi:hypothetical protein ABFP25_15640 [Acinetobacter indicus]|uniref:hypothetical protein n=1 Tax=Acinetobacter indicus TaxID=756892 RepID=UPI0032150B2D